MSLDPLSMVLALGLCLLCIAAVVIVATCIAGLLQAPRRRLTSSTEHPPMIQTLAAIAAVTADAGVLAGLIAVLVAGLNPERAPVTSALIALIVKLAANPRAWAVAAFAAVLAFAGMQTARLGHAKSDLAQARAAPIDPKTRAAWRAEYVTAAGDLATARQNVVTLTGALTTQNAALSALRALGARDSAKAQAAAHQANAANAAARIGAAKALDTVAGPDACASADKLILDSLGANP